MYFFNKFNLTKLMAKVSTKVSSSMPKTRKLSQHSQ
jgi:hypothetical protein